MIGCFIVLKSLSIMPCMIYMI